MSQEVVEKKVAMLDGIIDQKIGEFRKRRVEKKQVSFWLMIFILAASCLTTISLGRSLPGWEGILKNGGLVLSALLTSLTAYEAFLNPRPIYVQYTNTVAMLHGLKDEFQFHFSGPKEDWSDAKADELFERFLGIMDETRERWQQARRPKKSITSKESSS